jgi:DNA-binding transcriptional LysR family regulator
MQDLCYTRAMASNWNDLKFFLAIEEAKSFAGASRLLKVDETTVGRRLQALESELGTKLFERKRQGYTPTPAGRQVLEAALPIQAKLRSLQTRIEGGDRSLRGKVTLTMPESIATELVLPKLPEFLSRFEDLQVAFSTGSHTVNVSKREADIAIRMFKPKSGTLYARKLGPLHFSFYGARNSLQSGQINTLINYPDADATDAESAILKKLRPTIRQRIQVNSRHSMRAAIQAGVGVGMLPEIMGEKETELLRIVELPRLSLDTWMVVHADLKKNARVRVTADFLQKELSARLK